jgi:hypothetical protein
MSPDDEITEEIGFDENEELEEDDVVVLLINGERRELVLLAVVGLDDREYALLGAAQVEEEPEDGEEAEAAELLVARYDASAVGAARFGLVEDPAELEAVREALGDFVEMEG